MKIRVVPYHVMTIHFFAEHGKVVFHVDHEFEISLTLIGDSPNTPWTVISIDFLVKDVETGGKRIILNQL